MTAKPGSSTNFYVCSQKDALKMGQPKRWVKEKALFPFRLFIIPNYTVIMDMICLVIFIYFSCNDCSYTSSYRSSSDEAKLYL